MKTILYLSVFAVVILEGFFLYRHKVVRVEEPEAITQGHWVKVEEIYEAVLQAKKEKQSFESLVESWGPKLKGNVEAQGILEMGRFFLIPSGQRMDLLKKINRPNSGILGAALRKVVGKEGINDIFELLLSFGRGPESAEAEKLWAYQTLLWSGNRESIESLKKDYFDLSVKSRFALLSMFYNLCFPERDPNSASAGINSFQTVRSYQARFGTPNVVTDEAG